MFQKKYGNVTIQMVQAAKRGLCLMASRGHQRILFDFVGDDQEKIPDGTNAYMFGNKLILVTRWSDMSEDEKDTVRESPLTLVLHPGECIQMSLKIENAWGDVTLTLPHCVNGLNDENAPVDELIFLFGDTHDENFLISRSVMLPPFIQEVLRKANESTHRIMPMDQEIQTLSRKAAEDPERDFCDYFYAACMEKTVDYAVKAREIDPASVPNGIYIEIDGNDIIKNLYKNQKDDASEPEKESEAAEEAKPEINPESEIKRDSFAAAPAPQPDYPPVAATPEPPAAPQPEYPPAAPVQEPPAAPRWTPAPQPEYPPAAPVQEPPAAPRWTPAPQPEYPPAAPVQEPPAAPQWTPAPQPEYPPAAPVQEPPAAPQWTPAPQPEYPPAAPTQESPAAPQWTPAPQPEYPPAAPVQEPPAAPQWTPAPQPEYPPAAPVQEPPAAPQWTPAPAYAPEENIPAEPKAAAETEDASEYSDDVKIYLALAEKGIPEGAYNMGVCCEHGEGIEQNAEKAVEWYAKAAAQGFAKAIFNLGVCKYNGFGTQADHTTAAALFRKAAEAGDMYGQYNYGVCLFNGDGAAADAENAMKWLRKSAEQGNEMAVKALAELEK